jgi:hypothetical protein
MGLTQRRQGGAVRAADPGNALVNYTEAIELRNRDHPSAVLAKTKEFQHHYSERSFSLRSRPAY